MYINYLSLLLTAKICSVTVSTSFLSNRIYYLQAKLLDHLYSPDLGMLLLPEWWRGDNTWLICFVSTWMWHHSAYWAYKSQQFQWALGPAYTNYRTYFCIGSRRIWTECKGSQEGRQLWKMRCYHLCYTNWVWVEIWILFAWLKAPGENISVTVKYSDTLELTRYTERPPIRRCSTSGSRLFFYSVFEGAANVIINSSSREEGTRWVQNSIFGLRKSMHVGDGNHFAFFQFLPQKKEVVLEKYTLICCHSSITTGTPHCLFF